VFLLGLAIPATAVLIPLFYVVTSMGLYDTYWAIILPSAAFCLPVSVLIMTNFLRDVPNELFDAMAVDGATERAVLFRLVLPFSRPALMTVLIFNALAVWNGFIFPLILTSSPNYRVLPLAVFNFESYYTINVPAVLAAVVITSLPLVLLYVVGRRYLMTGMVAGYAK
jgi:raffinose/stachyose/melibiose transport system permease protein